MIDKQIVMHQRASPDSYHDAAALADALCYQCSELSGPYEIASNHLKILHSTLEEICAVLDYIPASRNIAALNAVVNECNRFLVAIDRALEYQDRQPLANNATDVKFTTRIQLITKKLLDTYRLVILPADISTCQATVNKHRRCATDSSILSDTSCELDGSALTTSRMESSGSAQGGVMVPSHASTHSSERPVSEAADGGHQNDVQMGRPTGPSPVVSDSWKAPFALADPMSSVRPPQDMGNDIETASYLILADDEAGSPMNVTLNTFKMPLRGLVALPDASSRFQSKLSLADHSPPSTTDSPTPAGSMPLSIKVDSVYGSGGLVASPSCRSSPELSQRTSRPDSSRPHSCTTTLSSESVHSSTPGQTQLRQVVAPRAKYRVVNADPSETMEESSDDTSKDDDSSECCGSSVPIAPEKNLRRTLRRRSLNASQNRNGQVFDWDSAHSLDSEADSSSAVKKEKPSQGLGLGLGEYTKVAPNASDSATEMERTERIVGYWNTNNFTQAELLLEDLLASSQTPQSDVERRTRHLLGIVASLDGRWQKALTLFASVLRTPLRNAAHLDEGDCAAVYWMGDIYTLANRRVEAMIAYSVVKQGMEIFNSSSTTSPGRLLERIEAEQGTCRSGCDKGYFELQLDQTVHTASTDSILSPEIITRESAREFLEGTQWSPNDDEVVKPNQSRAMAFLDLDPKTTARQEERHGLHLATSTFDPTAPWPLPFDPLFAIGNISCGMPLSSECNFLHIKKIPRASGTLSRSRINCFACPDLSWLILTLRACMAKLSLRYTEIANATGTWMIAQYASSEGGSIASVHFISISIFRLTFRSGFGVEICPGGIFSSRITTKVEQKNGEEERHAHELKRVKKLIRDYLDAALRRREAFEDSNTVVPVLSINGVTSLHRGALSKVEKRRSESSSSPATSSRSGSFF